MRGKNIERGDIFLTKLTNYEEGVQAGIRPVVVIQNDIGNIYSPTVIVAALTTKTKSINQPTHCKLETTYPFFSNENMLLAEQIFTITKKSLIKFIGSLNENDKDKLNKALTNSILT